MELDVVCVTGHLEDRGVETGVCGVVGMWQIDILVNGFAMGCFSIWFALCNEMLLNMESLIFSILGNPLELEFYLQGTLVSRGVL